MSFGKHINLGLLVVLFTAAGWDATAQTKLLRFPDIHEDRLVFTYAGDLWLAPADGGTAVRLTAHPGLELFAKFSPDGQWVAFTGQYDGDEQIYVVPSGGGVPRQLTYYPARGPLPPRWGYDNQVYGWTPDGSAVLIRSLRDGWDLSDSRLYTVPLSGGLPQPLPMPVSGAGDLSPDGRQVVYSPLFRDFRTWKRYQGGWAQDLWIFDIETSQAENVTNHPRSDRDPMWVGDQILFSSDRSGTLNLYSYDPASRETAPVTQYTDWDVRWPSADYAGNVVYELGGELYVLDAATSESRPIQVRVPDDGLAMRPSHIQVRRNIEGYSLSPKGERAIFVARGDVFTAPIESGPTRSITKSSNAHDKLATWSPDGSRIAYVSDATGEEEIYVMNQDGSGDPEQLTTGNEGMLFGIEWSPDGERLAYTDKNGKLYVLEVESKRVTEVADERYGLIGGGSWSANGGHIAFTLRDATGFSSIYIWSVADGQVRRITGEYFNEFSPAWDPDGEYLYYIADREYAPMIGSFEWNFVVDRESYIYALALREDVSHPFPPKSDEVSIEEEGEEDEAEEEEDQDENGYIRIDFDGLAERVARVPVGADNYGGLSANEGNLIYVRGTPFYYGRSAGSRPAIMVYSLEDREATALVEGSGSYTLSSDGSKLLVREGSDYNLYDASPSGQGSKKTVSTSGLALDRVPREEWNQIFGEVWRRFRDFFYVANMHGYDWNALRQQYEPLLEHVAHRSDLNYVMGEMVAELNVSHAYITGGDFEIPDRPSVALPGARFTLDEGSDRYRITRIFTGHNEEDRYRSPLTEIGVDVAVGDYVLAIDGEELSGDENPYRMLRNKADQPVTLTVNSRPDLDGSRQVIYRPVTNEVSLKYLSWVEQNRDRVNRMTEGRVGYMHLPDMGSNGIREFVKWYYGQIKKEGMIVDVRGNGGGNVSAMLIQRLNRELLALGYQRLREDATTYPGTVFLGHLVAILNETSASDGDIFPAMFRQAGLGPLIGKRSWGGVIGITGYGPLIDGGGVNVPQFGWADAEGQWAIENYGVEPDITVENDPASVLAGGDPQLERAIEEVLRRMAEDPRQLPPRPVAPVKRP
ncbi:MAG: PD40 domain-containing protein [Gemmatimonadota bacterium]|nr:MAG: PD40 domain-containing protein [Gemmatimonadota bacterium]